MRLILVVALVGSAGCLRTTQFHCSAATDCGAGGSCELSGYCSFPDGLCTSGRRYGDLSGSLSKVCVGAEIDAGVSVDAPRPIDASLIDAPAGADCFGTQLVTECLMAPPNARTAFKTSTISLIGAVTVVSSKDVVPPVA